MSDSDLLPLVEELLPAPEPQEVFVRLAHLPHCLFLDSAMRNPQLGRYSFVAADPFDFIQVAADQSDGLAALRHRMAPYTASACRRPDLPPFQGGAAGLLSYELGRSLEVVPAAAHDEFGIPAVAFGLYDVVVAFDHVADRAWIISQGWPESEPARRRQRAAQRLAEARDWLATPPSTDVFRPATSTSALASDLAPQYPVSGISGLTSNFTKRAYLDAVQRVIDYIYAGDVFQVNLSQRLLTPAQTDSVSLYRRLRRCNPAPMAGYFDLGDFQIVSASPERFLQVNDGWVESRPIKGTRPRSGVLATDQTAEAELLASEKDRAENVMIVDLLRNDLSRVCTADSVHVSQLCGVEAYQYVLHLVSAVRGRLRPGLSALDLLHASFPGGSITGAPKVRAMEIIAEFEPTARGPYCGALGYIGFDGAADLSILIRTITAGRGWWQFPVGGGIVAQSDPEQEYAETWQKAEGILQALT